jgi:magnesium-transporting ATPase (P-type)
VTVALGHRIDAGVIRAVVIANAVIGFVQEGEAETAMAAIRDMLPLGAAVLRDGRRVTVEAAALVPGDVVLIEAGDRVPANLRPIEAREMTADEAILTGASVPVEKTAHPVPAADALADRRPMLWSGTLIAQGSGRGLVVATGAATEIGRIGGLLAGVEDLTTPLLSQIDRFGRRLSGVILLVAALTLAWDHLAGRLPFPDIFMAVVGMAVAAIPEGLPAVMTIAVTYLPGLQALLGTAAVPLADGLLIPGVGIGFLAVLEAEKRIRPRAFGPDRDESA